MDMMRPVSLVLPPNAPDGVALSIVGSGNNKRIAVTWNDNSITETAFVIQRTTNGTTWTNVGTVQSPLGQPNTHGVRNFTDASSSATTPYLYRVVAQNTAGYGNGFPTMTAQSVSTVVGINSPAAPTSLTATLQAGPQVSLTWRDNATNESGFSIQRSTDGVNFAQIATAPAKSNTGNVTFVDTTITAGATYTYRVSAFNVAGSSVYSNLIAAAIPAAPAAPSNFTAVNGPNGGGNSRSVVLTWLDNSTNETGFIIQRATNAAFTTGLTSTNVAAGAGTGTRTLTVTGLSRNTSYYFRIRSANGTIIFSGWVNATPLPILTNP
jgi:hypothetical protein